MPKTRSSSAAERRNPPHGRMNEVQPPPVPAVALARPAPLPPLRPPEVPTAASNYHYGMPAWTPTTTNPFAGHPPVRSIPLQAQLPPEGRDGAPANSDGATATSTAGEASASAAGNLAAPAPTAVPAPAVAHTRAVAPVHTAARAHAAAEDPGRTAEPQGPAPQQQFVDYEHFDRLMYMVSDMNHRVNAYAGYQWVPPPPPSPHQQTQQTQPTVTASRHTHHSESAINEGNSRGSRRKELEYPEAPEGKRHIYNTPLAVEIQREVMPSRFKMPQMEPYDGTGDPNDHIDTYEQMMMIHNIPHAAMCKAFSITLRGAAKTWFSKLPRESIGSFEELKTLFITHFMGTRHVLPTATGQAFPLPLPLLSSRFGTYGTRRYHLDRQS